MVIADQQSIALPPQCTLGLMHSTCYESSYRAFFVAGYLSADG